MKGNSELKYQHLFFHANRISGNCVIKYVFPQKLYAASASADEDESGDSEEEADWMMT